MLRKAIMEKAKKKIEARGAYKLTFSLGAKDASYGSKKERKNCL